tara:strand:- start:29310 stop:29915 length:606 start_codon:yes stop_codon:yes gene_type:complete
MSNVVFLGPSDNFIADSLRRRESVSKLFITEEKINLEFLSEFEAEKIISYGYRHILGGDIVSAYDKKIVNLHISYLPFNRGANPNLWSIVEDTQPGVSIHYIDKGIDTGDILCQDKVKLDYQHDTLGTSYQKLREQIEFLYLDMSHPLGRKWVVKEQLHKGTYHSIRQTDELLGKLNLSDGWDTKISEVAEKATKLGYRNE